MSIDLNADVEHTLVAAHFFPRSSKSATYFRKILSMEYPIKTFFFACYKQRCIHLNWLQLPTFKPCIVWNDMIRCIADINTLVQGAVNSEELSNSDAYIHAVELCLLLTKLSKLPAIRTLYVETISLNQASSHLRIVCT
ncbi:hypothetical protein PsorP6_009477 [Peronosclerospora sorghi]|uniref:Uncharacterized protein n=1 Tax=Peronosclerospora sorghi TaxID=230839 RepID=A0ACC0W0I4_9STRA|nr:hypothetical protein PsorP6_009477 [Peronosclerospora sorghi]